MVTTPMPLCPPERAELTPRRHVSGAEARRMADAGEPLHDLEVRGLFALAGAELTGSLVNVSFRPHDPDDALRDVSLNHTRIEHCSFSGCRIANVGLEAATIIGCSFGERLYPWTHLEAVRLQGAQLIGCDLRYCRIERTSFKDATIAWCDLYRAELDPGTHFERTQIYASSLYLTNLNGSDLAPSNLVDGLVQESPELFRMFHQHFGTVSEDVQAHLVADGDKEAISIYTALGGLATAAGHYSNESLLYVRKKRIQRRVARRSLSDPSASDEVDPGSFLHRALRWGGLALADVTSGFGESSARVVRAVAVVGLAAAALLYAGDGLRVDGDPMSSDWQRARTALLFAFGNFVGRDPSSTSVHGSVMEGLLIAQTFIGIALAGVLGMVIASRIRQS